MASFEENKGKDGKPEEGTEAGQPAPEAEATEGATETPVDETETTGPHTADDIPVLTDAVEPEDTPAADDQAGEAEATRNTGPNIPLITLDDDDEIKTPAPTAVTSPEDNDGDENDSEKPGAEFLEPVSATAEPVSTTPAEVEVEPEEPIAPVLSAEPQPVEIDEEDEEPEAPDAKSQAEPLLNETEQATPQEEKKRGWLGTVFKAAAFMGLGAGTSIGFKMLFAATFAAAPQLAVILGTAVAVSLVVAGARQLLETTKPKEQRQNFFTLKNLAFSFAFSAVGSAIALNFEDLKDGALALWNGNEVIADPQADVIDGTQPPLITETVPEIPQTEVPPVAPAPEAEVVPAVPVPEAETAPAPVPEAETAPTPEAEVAPTPVPETETAPVVPAPEATPVPVEQTALDKVLANLPANTTAPLADTLARLESASEAVRDQAIKDLGNFIANGFHFFEENDALANELFAMVADTNAQAAHDLGYQMLHGLGTEVDYAKAYELLSFANDNGNTLAAEKLQYMAKMGLTPA